MKDERNEVLANILLTYSVDLQPGEKIMLELRGEETLELAKEIIKQATQLGGVPFWYYNDPSLTRHLIQSASEAQFEAFGQLHLKLAKECDAWLGLYAPDNAFELAEIDAGQLKLYQKLYVDPVQLKERVRNSKWCLLTFPTNSRAQLAEMSKEAFEDLYYDVCCLDYAKMSQAMDPLVELMEKTNKVRIVAPGTDLSFSIKGIPMVKCDGKENIPDGEVFTAPVRDSINGHVTFNTPAIQRGFLFNGIRLEFEEGKVVEASCQAGTDKLNEILDVDEGARYIGEFALGVNPYVSRPMKDALFDEKIAGSLHLALGQCDQEAPNGNESAIHWDIVLLQTKEHGGGEIYFDGRSIRKDGAFVDEKLEESFSANALRGL
ncbi:MAG: aminopeptidase [Chloroflexi bacterium B3_Chlor]|nr:MAG: aminopeptidase [Chloroflexi bacterium B3_Chlor]